jgi:hypothetical protein
MHWVPCRFLIPGKLAIRRESITTGPLSLYSPYRIPREWFTGEMERVKKIRSEYRFKMAGYTVLLGGQGMNPLPPQLFVDQDELYLKVLFDNGGWAGHASSCT